MTTLFADEPLFLGLRTVVLKKAAKSDRPPLTAAGDYFAVVSTITEAGGTVTSMPLFISGPADS